MYKIILLQGEEIFIEDSDIKYSTYLNTPVFVSDKVYFSDDDNFFHFSKDNEKNNNITDDITKLIKDIKVFFGLCSIKNNISTEIDNIDKIINIEDKLWIEIKKGTTIKMNNLPIILGADTMFLIKKDTNFIIPENNDIEIVSRNNIIKIINKENINCKFSKIL